MKILIIGPTPPPIGGVTIHVSRLIKALSYLNFNQFIHSTINKKIIYLFFRHKNIHLHTSNPYLRFFLSFLGFLMKKNVIITYHGNLLRFNKIKNIFDLLSIYFSSVPIVLNNDSLIIARKRNKNALIISAFIPPVEQEGLLMQNVIDEIKLLKKKYFIFCTNAYNISYDKFGKEIYGIVDLIKKFNNQKKYALVISDPSGNYKKYIEASKIIVNDNIYFISKPHSFFEVLKLADAFVRNTTTDGDSLSIHEALFLKKQVLATNVVQRPNECILYENIFSLNLDEIFLKKEKITIKESFTSNSVLKLISVYKRFI